MAAPLEKEFKVIILKANKQMNQFLFSPSY